MGKNALPTLTKNKFLTDPNEMLKRIYYYYVTSDYGQTISFFGYVKSIREAFKRADFKPDRAQEEVTADLNFICSNYWNKYQTSVTVKSKELPSGENKIIYVVDIDIEVTDDTGKKHYLSETLEIDENENLKFKDSLDYLISA